MNMRDKPSLRLDLTGQKFNNLTAIEYVGKDKWGKSAWKFKCDCGNELITNASSVKNGYTRSCGCIRRNMGTVWKKHGKSESRLYGIWCGMRQRCNKPRRAETIYYKDIKVCDEWLDFSNFQDWALSNGYQENLTIDRIDNNKGYEPSNCRWADQKVQQNNRTNNVRISHKGITKNKYEWLRFFGLKYDGFAYWNKKGLSNEQIVEHYMREKGVQTV